MITSSTPTPRVASLLPAATEIVAGLGLAELLVGRSHECDWPAGVARLPILTHSRVSTSGSSAEIDRDVRSTARSALGVYDVDLDALRAVRPDVILTQDLCDVCAVPFSEVQRAVAELGLADTRIVSLKPLRLDDIWRDIRTVAEALGEPARGAELTTALLARCELVRQRARRLRAHPKVLTIEWLDPVMVGGTWMPELVELAGGVALVARAGEKAPTLSQAELARLRPAPEVVLLKPCGFTLARSLMEIETIVRLISSVPWPAAIQGEVFLADGNAYFNRPGPRIVDSLEILAACLHPFDFADLGTRHTRAYTRLALRSDARQPA